MIQSAKRKLILPDERGREFVRCPVHPWRTVPIDNRRYIEKWGQVPCCCVTPSSGCTYCNQYNEAPTEAEKACIFQLVLSVSYTFFGAKTVNINDAFDIPWTTTGRFNVSAYASSGTHYLDYGSTLLCNSVVNEVSWEVVLNLRLELGGTEYFITGARYGVTYSYTPVSPIPDICVDQMIADGYDEWPLTESNFNASFSASGSWGDPVSVS